MTDTIAKPASASRTLRFNRLAMVWTSALTVLPSLLGWLLEALHLNPRS